MATQVSQSTIHNSSFPFHVILCLLSLLVSALLPPGVMAHETWVLTPEQVAEWNARPKPEIFTQLSAISLAIYLFAVLGLVSFIVLHRSAWSSKLFPGPQARLAAYGEYAPVALRLALFIMLGMGCLGLAPRLGTGLMESPALAAPDLELRLVPGSWSWVAVVEGALAVSFLLGIYVRGAAALLVGLGILGLFLFGQAMCAYIGLVGAAAVYLLLQGAGPYAMPLPSVPRTDKLSAWLADLPRERAQWLLQLLAGANLLYLGLEYKFRQPNLMMGVLEINRVPTLGMEPGTFVLWMAVVETLAGALILSGVMIRPVSIGLFVSFAFFSLVLGEGVLSHIIFYGLLVPLITNGAGRWRAPVATDKGANIEVPQMGQHAWGAPFGWSWGRPQP